MWPNPTSQLDNTESPGFGKTHLAQAIGCNALKFGFLVLYRSILDLAREFLREIGRAHV